MKKNTEFTIKRFLIDVITDVVVVFLLVQVIRLYIFAPFRVHGPSMCNTFNIYNDECYNGDGEYILVSKFSVISLFGWRPGEINRGDILVFQAPGLTEGEYYIKRVIGEPGDKIKIANGFVYLMDAQGDYQKLDEDYLNEDNLGKTYTYRTIEQEYEVPDDKYFLLGDNRNKSSDSRRCFNQLGCNTESSPYLDFDYIQGEVKIVVFPLTHIRWISNPDYSI